MVNLSVQSAKSAICHLSQILTQTPNLLKNCKGCAREKKDLEDNTRSRTLRTLRITRTSGRTCAPGSQTACENARGRAVGEIFFLKQRRIDGRPVCSSGRYQAQSSNKAHDIIS